MKLKGNKITLGFDLGAKSIAGAIAVDGKVAHLDSLIFPEDWGSMSESRNKRRLARTRLAHRAREYHWWYHAKKAGIPVPYDYDPESVEKKEYRIRIAPSQEAHEAYNRFKAPNPPPVVLRIQLLEGKKLSGEEVFKAIHHAIQKRGMDYDVPWKTSEKSTSETEVKAELLKKKPEELKPEEKLEVARYHFKQDSEELPQGYDYPCYLLAWKMGLWNPCSKKFHRDDFHERTDREKREFKVRGRYAFPRDWVERELVALLKQAKKLFPKLDIEAILGKMPSKKMLKGVNEQYHEKLRYYQGHQSVLGQKWPKFENRAVGSCRVIPRFKAAKRSAEEFRDFYYLSQFHKLSVRDGSGVACRLTAQDVRELFQHFQERIKNGEGIPATHLHSALSQLGYELISEKASIEKWNHEGRCAYSKVALRLLNRIYIGEVTPDEAYDTFLNDPIAANSTKKVKDNKDPLKGLVPADLELFYLMKKLKMDYAGFYLPQLPKKISSEEFIKQVPSPRVRVRLQLFLRLLRDFKKRVGGAKNIDKVVIELVRDPHASFKAAQISDKQKWDQQVWEKAKQQAQRYFKSPSDDQILKTMLWQEQQGTCVYSGEKLCLTRLDEYEIEHIVPRKLGGGNQRSNLVLTTRKWNQEKGRRIPYHWLGEHKERWEEFCLRLTQIYKTDKLWQRKYYEKKVKVLLAQEIPEEALSNRALVATAYLEKLAHQLCYLEMGWTMPSDHHEKPVEQKVWVVPGYLTAKYGKKLERERWLELVPQSEGNTKNQDKKSSKESKSGKSEKERSNPRHHAFDAGVCALLPQWYSLAVTQKMSKAKYHREREINDSVDIFATPLPAKVNPKSVIGDAILNHYPIVLPDKKPKLSEEFVNLYRYAREVVGKRFETTQLPKRVSGEYLLHDIQYAKDVGGHRGFVALKKWNEKKERFDYFVFKWPSYESFEQFFSNVRASEGELVWPYLFAPGQWFSVQAKESVRGEKKKDQSIPSGIFRLGSLMNEVKFVFESPQSEPWMKNIAPLLEGAHVDLFFPDSVFVHLIRRPLSLSKRTTKAA